MQFALSVNALNTDVGLLVTQEVFDALPIAQSWLGGLSQSECLDQHLTLDYRPHEGLLLNWRQPEQRKAMKYALDFVTSYRALRSFPAPKQGAFNQALGKKTRSVLDTTGGFGGDAMLMATQGYQVTVQERHPLVALLLHDAFLRLDRALENTETALIAPKVRFLNSIDANKELTKYDHYDCAYLDPMFPPKRKKTAASNKQMQLLQWLIGEDLDATSLLDSVIESGIPRVAVKRPDYAKPLREPPSQQFSSKLIHYDVYLNSGPHLA